MTFTKPQRRAIEKHCRLAAETMQFGRMLPIGASVVLSVNSGYE